MASGRPSVTHGAISAFVMNACLLILALATADLFVTLSDGGAYGYPATAAAKRDTRARIEHVAVRLLPSGVDRRRGWEALVARELREGDPRAARGFVLSAQTLLSPADAGRIDREVGSRATDAEIAAAAEALLSNETRGEFSEAARWMAQSDVSDRDPAAFLVLGEERDLAQQARDWLSGRDPDHLALTLVGVGAALGESVGARVALGASALKDARRANRLGRGLALGLEAAAERAAPSDRLRAALFAATADPGALADEGRAAANAFRSIVDPEGMEALKAHLAEVGDMAAATSSRGAARLLAQARDVRDLPRLRLVAQAGGDRAVAVAKRLRDGAPLAEAARGSIHWTQPLAFSAIAIGVAALGIIGATLMALAQALGEAWLAMPGRRRNAQPAN